MQYLVPQFIESEGKIISFLTFKQFFLLVGGGFVCLLLYFILPYALFVIGAIMVMLPIGIIAFVKIDNASVFKIFLNFVGFSMGAKHYSWKKKESPYPFKTVPMKVLDQESPVSVNPSVALPPQPSKLNEIKTMIETKR